MVTGENNTPVHEHLSAARVVWTMDYVWAMDRITTQWTSRYVVQEP